MWAQETTLCDFKTILTTQTLSASNKSRVNKGKECKYTVHVTSRVHQARVQCHGVM